MLETMMELQVPLYLMGALGVLGAAGMAATSLTYRRMMKHAGHLDNLKEKWLNLWKTRDKLLHRMNRLVWYPALLSTILLGVAVFQESRFVGRRGLPMSYLYVGAAVPVILLLLRQILDFSYKETLIMSSLTDYLEKARAWALPMSYLYVGAAVPVILLLLRQILDFSYKETLIMSSLTDYLEKARAWAEELPVQQKSNPVLQEEVVERITSSIRQTAATGSHFSKMLSPEEEKIMRDIIREFMGQAEE